MHEFMPVARSTIGTPSRSGPPSSSPLTLINPDIAQYNVFAYNANSFYSAGTFQVTRRMRNNLSLNAHFTWSKATDESTDFNSDYAPNDELDLRADRGLSPFNAAMSAKLPPLGTSRSASF